ncbi:MAG TPA: FlgD immunoglobulin-like domain containing protein [Candidatus Cloacimonadota bacterium]|nr:FlgD immunoglobulin-like domain containing protein [Candidatus Cloacimonadota bacterium]
MPRAIWITLLCWVLSLSSLSSITRIVDITGGDQYTSIQTAINASSPGDTVLVYPGRYFENVIISTSNLSLLSLESTTQNMAYVDSTIIDGSNSSQCLMINPNIQNISIRGFSLTKGKGACTALLEGSITTITNCKLFDNWSGNGGGIHIAGATVHLSGVSIFNNYAYNMGGGIYANSPTGYVNNISFDPSNRCSIYNNRAGAGQDFFIQNATSDVTMYLDTFSVLNPSNYHAMFMNYYGTNYQLIMDIQNAYQTEIDHDLYVSPDGDDSNDGLSPETALKTIHTAIYRIASDSLCQRTVHILPGTYSRSVNQQIFPIALKSWVKVVGSGIGNTEIILEPHPQLSSDWSVILFLTSNQANVTVSGMSMTSVNTDNSCAILGRKEYNLHLSDLHMYDFSPNSLAVLQFSYAINSNWDGLIVENIETSRWGFVYVDGCFNGTIQNSTFRNGTSTLVTTAWAYPLISITVDGNINIDNCTFSNLVMYDDDTHAVQFGSVQYPQQSNSFHISNCLLNDIVGYDTTIFFYSGNNPSMHITNCTFAGNTGNTYTLMVNGNVNVTNSIFFNNTPYQIKVNPMANSGETTTLTIDYSCLLGGIAGIQQASSSTVTYLGTNINTNPLFLGGDEFDPLRYSLSLSSPCINSGTPDTTGLGLLPYDLAGNLRIWNDRIDMGCYEYGSEPWVDSDDPVVPELPAPKLAAYPNPFTVFTNLKVILPSNRCNGKTRVTNASIDIYNIKGQKVKSIALDPGKAGEQFSYWDGRDEAGRQCSSGIYLLNLKVNGIGALSKKVTLVR